MKKEDYILLIQRNLKGELSPSEFVKFNIEAAKDPVLADLRLEIEDAWDVTGENENLITAADTEALINRIKNSKNSIQTEAVTQQNKKPSTSKIFSLQKLITGIAAILVLALGAIWLLRDQVTIYDTAGTYTLADNSVVTLREGSTLKASSFEKDNRIVELNGEAFFEVSKDAQRPFSVLGSNVEIEVLGTSFLVKETGDNTYIDLKEGKISTSDKRTQSKEILTAGMQAHHNAEGKIIVSSGTSNLSAWKDEYYQFSNVQLGDALAELALIFNTEITVSNSALLACNFSGNIAGKSLNELLRRIAVIHKMEVKQDGSNWILSGDSCK